MPDHDHAVAQKRDLGLAIRRGLMGKCPSCGEAKLFGRFLKPVESCPVCHEHWAERRADDFPAYLVILIVGHVLVPIIVEVNIYGLVPMVAQMILWPAIAIAASLALIQPFKGAVLGLLWAR